MEEQSLPTAAKVALVVKVSMRLLLTGIGEMVSIPQQRSDSSQEELEQTMFGTK